LKELTEVNPYARDNYDMQRTLAVREQFTRWQSRRSRFDKFEDFLHAFLFFTMMRLQHQKKPFVYDVCSSIDASLIVGNYLVHDHDVELRSICSS
jgi:hypothetical protein